MTTRRQVSLAAHADAVAAARHFLAEHAADLPADLLDDAQLLVCELVGNAVRHGLPAITLQLELDPHCIAVAVHDHGPDIPTAPARLPASTQTSGRGLLIVAAMADHWGVTPFTDGQGKTVWFDLTG